MKKLLLLSLSLLSTSLGYIGAYADELTDIINKGEASGAKASEEASALIDDFRKYAAQRSGQKAVKNFPLAHEGKKGCRDKETQGTGKCGSSLLQNLEQKNSDSSHLNTQLLIFISESVPENSIKELWNQAQKVGGKLVIRGLVGGSFKATQQYIQGLGIVADIDPTKFEEFEVTQVPTFVLSKEGNYDKMVGNISLVEFLEQSSANGDLKEEAAEHYKKLQGVHP
ncbi:MAG: type-F conjugative transfer system pilin assembly protein TrbC [Candidatus Paracaedibacter sp.]